MERLIIGMRRRVSKFVVMILVDLIVLFGTAYLVGLSQAWANSRFEGSPVDHPIWIPTALLSIIIIFYVIASMLDWFLKVKSKYE